MVVGQIAESADFVVAGAGPGGYVAALRAAQLGRTANCAKIGCGDGSHA